MISNINTTDFVTPSTGGLKGEGSVSNPPLDSKALLDEFFAKTLFQPNVSSVCTPTKSGNKGRYAKAKYPKVKYPPTPKPSPFPINGYTHPWTPSTYNPWVPLPALSGTQPKILFGAPLPDSPKSKSVRDSVHEHYDNYDNDNGIEFSDYHMEMLVEDEEWQDRMVGNAVDGEYHLDDYGMDGEVVQFDYGSYEDSYNYGDYDHGYESDGWKSEMKDQDW